jgi:hypothetical protein
MIRIALIMLLFPFLNTLINNNIYVTFRNTSGSASTTLYLQKRYANISSRLL